MMAFGLMLAIMAGITAISALGSLTTRNHLFFFSNRSRHTRSWRDWSSDVCSSDLRGLAGVGPVHLVAGAALDPACVANNVNGSADRKSVVRKEGRSRWSPYH